MMRELWKEIENTDPGVCRPAACLLQVLFENANQQQASLFVEPTLKLIMPILKQPTPITVDPERDADQENVICTLIDCIASMASVDGGPIDNDSMIDIFETIIPLLGLDHSNSKRLSTLRCIGELSEYHSYVITPYRDHSALISSLLICLQDPEINETALKVLKICSGQIAP